MARVLIIDDDDAVRQAIRIALERLGHESVAASGAVEGIERAEAGTFALALVDMYMPNVNGLEAIKVIGRLRPRVPIIAMSGGSIQTSAEDFAVLAVSMGAHSFLPKPFTLSEI